RTRRPTTADDYVHCSLRSVDHVGGGRSRDRRKGNVRLLTTDRMRAFVMVFVPAHHEVDAILIEQGDPLLADPESCAIELVARRDGNLVHAHYDPVDIMITAGRGQLLFQPGPLRTRRIISNVGVTAVLVTDVVIRNADHADRAGGECIPKTTRDLGLAGRR